MLVGLLFGRLFLRLLGRWSIGLWFEDGLLLCRRVDLGDVSFVHRN